MNAIFAEDAALAAPLRSLLARLCDSEVSHIILAIADDDVVRQETTAEMGELLSGRYRLAEFDFGDAPLPSLPRFYRQLAGGLPACVFAHGLDVVKARDTQRYEEALHFLNAHREDLHLAPGALVLWLTTETWKDVQEDAPDFADWESASASFVLPPDQRLERTALGRLSIGEAEDLRQQAAGFKEMLARPNLGMALEAEFKKQLDLAERRLGRVADVRRDYRLYLVDELREHVLRRFAPQVGGRVLSLPLAKIFLPLRAVEGRPALAEYAAEDLQWQEAAEDFGDLDWRSRREEMEKRQARLQERQTAQRALTLKDLLKERRAVLLGDPGTGKTTVCRYVAWALAAEDLTHIGDAARGRLPVLVRLAEFGKALEAESELTLLDYVGSHLLSQAAFGACLRSAIEDGESVVILDGLDEVTDPELRAVVTGRIQAMVSAYGANRYLVSSRIVGYERSPLTRDFRHATLRELEDSDRKRFVELWYTAIRAAIPERSVVAMESDLIETLEKKPQIARMAANPLLLTIMVLMHWRGIKLPNRRVQVYQNATDTLIEYWTAERVALDAEEVKQILAPVAHYIQSSSVGGVIARRDLLPRLRDGIVAQRGCDSEAAESFCDELLRLLGEQSGIFLERGLDAQGQPVYGFLHQTFGEYLAALQLANEVLDGSFEIEGYIHRSAWHESLLLLAGHLSLFSQAHASLLVRVILHYPCPWEKTLRRNVLLAAECLADDVQVAPALRDEVLRKLADLLLHTATQPRQAALEVYRQLGRTRHREPAAVSVKSLCEAWDGQDRLVHGETPKALACATALVQLHEAATAERILDRLELGFEYKTAIRRLRLEGWPEKAESFLLTWDELGDPFEVGADIAGTTLRGVNADVFRTLIGPDAFCRLLEKILADQRIPQSVRPKLCWILALASTPPSKEILLSLTTSKNPFTVRVLAATRLLETEHRRSALNALQEMASLGVMSASEKLLEAGESDLIDWSVVRDIAFMPYGSIVPGAIGLLLKAGRIELALPATFHLLATNWERGYSIRFDPFLPVVERLAVEGHQEVATAIARWLALWPGYGRRFEAVESLIGSDGIEDAINLLRFVAYECHGETSQKASKRLLMMKELDAALSVLTQQAKTASPDLKYEASKALALGFRASTPVVESSRIELKTMILEERQSTYRAALDMLYQVGIGALNEHNSTDPAITEVTALGRLSLAWLCGCGSLRDLTASLPDESDGISMVVGANLALFEWRNGHLERARERLRRLATKHGFDTVFETRPWPLQALSRIHGLEAASALNGVLRDPDPLIRVTAIESLGESMPEDYTRLLVEALEDSDEEVRSVAVLMLGESRARSVSEILVKALHDKSALVRGSAAEALGLLGLPSAVQALAIAYSKEDLTNRHVILEALKRIRHTTSIPVLIAALSDKEPGVRRVAVSALGQFRDDGAVQKTLFEAVLDLDPDVSKTAVSAIARISDCSVAEKLIETLSHNNPLQRNAALGLAECGDPTGMKVLIEMLSDQSARIRISAAIALGKLRIPTATHALLRAIDDRDSRVRAAVVRALGQGSDPSIQRAVLSRLKDKDATVRCAALGSLEELPESVRADAFLEAIEDLDPLVRRAAVWSLRSNLSPAVVQRLLAALNDEDPGVVCGAVHSLGRCGADGVEPLLLSLLGAEDGHVRIEACCALERLPASRAVGGSLVTLLNDSDGAVRAQAVSILGRRRDPVAYDQLSILLRDQHASTRRVTAEALGRYGFLEAIGPLMATGVQILMTTSRSLPYHFLAPDDRRTLASIAQSLARLNASEALQFLVACAIPTRDFIRALIPFDAKSALQVLDRFANPLRDETWPHYLRGHALWRIGRLSQARTSFRQAAIKEDLDTLLSLALFDLERNNLRGASHHVDRALKKGKRPIDLLTRAVVQCRRGEIGKAQDGLEQARRKNPYVTDAQDLEFDHLWRAEALAALSELLGYVDKYETDVTYSEVAEPQAGYDPPSPG